MLFRSPDMANGDPILHTAIQNFEKDLKKKAIKLLSSKRIDESYLENIIKNPLKHWGKFEDVRKLAVEELISDESRVTKYRIKADGKNMVGNETWDFMGGYVRDAKYVMKPDGAMEFILETSVKPYRNPDYVAMYASAFKAVVNPFASSQLKILGNKEYIGLIAPIKLNAHPGALFTSMMLQNIVPIMRDAEIGRASCRERV